MAASYAEAAKGDKTQSQSYDDTMTGVKPIFLLEEDVFGNDLVHSNGQRYFLTHWEVYHAIIEQVPVKSSSSKIWRIYLITGLKRVPCILGKIWNRNIRSDYFDNEMDKKVLNVGKYWANINHYGQPHPTRPSTKCSKCLDEGHTARECPNGWKCKKCGQFGHKQFECTENMNSDSEGNEDGENNKSLEEGNSQNITKPSMSIEERKKSDNDPPKSNKNTGHKESITRYLTTKGRDQDSTNNTHDTPKKSRNKNPNFEKSPVTPTENLHDATRETAAKKPKKKS
ncbi:unnamed protein product [Mytilus coruscus]|uniref:CCHC-type domain-containing protein n=1 Tax=Mytilus coruscus TaxID=42192 RepID=A0A6J8E4R6_MYTCO|nr:unnamed protein product [Mytilus coruscus]